MMFYKKNNKKGFSLIESIVSMMIIAIVIMTSLAVITRRKPETIGKTTISGIYACWHNGSTYRQQTCHGQVCPAATSASGGKCTFEMDRRAYKYYIFAVGMRKNNYDPQLVQGYYPAPAGTEANQMKLNIELGNSSTGGITTVKNYNNDIVARALGGYEAPGTNFELVPFNIKSCKWVNGGSCAHKSCSIINNESKEYLASGKYPYITAARITCILDKSGTVDGENSKTINIKKLSPAGTGDNASQYTGDGYTLSIQEYDSQYKAKQTDISKSAFVKFLKMMPENIQNGLTDTILNDYQTSGNKNGAVVIIW